jgi:hypothetical protein
MRVKGNHPLAEILGKKLLGIEIVPKEEQVKMVNRAIKAAVEWVDKREDDIKIVCDNFLILHDDDMLHCPCRPCAAARKLMEVSK